MGNVMHHLSSSPWLPPKGYRRVILGSHDPAQLGQADNPFAGEVRHMCSAHEREHVMLAHGSDWKVSGQDEAVVCAVILKCGQVERPWFEHFCE
jgi:hypothetical protein